MNTMKKRVLSGVLAIAAAASMAVPAFAEDPAPAEPNMTTTVTGGFTKTTIAVTVPTTGTAYINPYGLGTSVTDSEGNKHDILGQIVSAPMAITNESNLKLKVSATVSTTIAGTSPLELSGTAIAAADKTKKANIKIEMASAKFAGEAAGLNDAVMRECADSTTGWVTAKAITLTKTDPAGTPKVDPVTVTDIVTLKAANQEDGRFASYAEGSVALVRFTGTCVEEPRKADDSAADPWAADDKFTATIVFTFKPDLTPDTPATPDP